MAEFIRYIAIPNAVAIQPQLLPQRLKKISHIPVYSHRPALFSTITYANAVKLATAIAHGIFSLLHFRFNYAFAASTDFEEESTLLKLDGMFFR